MEIMKKITFYFYMVDIVDVFMMVAISLNNLNVNIKSGNWSKIRTNTTLIL